MRLLAKLQKIDIPENMLVDGKIEITNAKLITNQSTQDVTTGFKIELSMTISTEINGFKIDPFQTKIAHTLSQQEFNHFMDHLRALPFLK